MSAPHFYLYGGLTAFAVLGLVAGLRRAAIRFATTGGTPEAPVAGHAPADHGTETQIDRRIALSRRRVLAAVRAHQEALARSPLPAAAPPAVTKRRAEWSKESALGWLGSRWWTGFLWGVVIGLIIEVIGVVFLTRLAAGIRRLGL